MGSELRLALAAALVCLVAAEAGAKPPSWDRKIDSPKRFKVLKPFASAAVLDQETGLVWERTPTADFIDFALAIQHCMGTHTGGRHGWRLPRMDELTSLTATSQFTLPDGHPFDLGEGGAFWSFSTLAINTGVNEGIAHAVTFGTGTGQSAKATPLRVWCVRGGPSYDGF